MRRLSVFLIAATACFATPAFANIYTVGSGAGCTHATIQAAIDAADAASSNVADEIRLSGGSFVNQQLTVQIEAAHGALTLVGGFATCASATPTAGARAVISGQSPVTSNPVMRVADTADLTLRNLEIRQGNGGGGLALETGGGTATSWITLIDTFVVNNLGTQGGGVRVANFNPATPPDRLRVDLLGTTKVAYNFGQVRGGGMYCLNARLNVEENAVIRENTAGVAGFAGNLDGGGIYADNCHLNITSQGDPGTGALYFNTAAMAGRGGGLYITGSQAQADFYPVASGMSLLVSLNRAREGGGIAAAGGAQVRMFGETVLIDNMADVSGGALWVAPGGAAGVDTRVLVQSAIVGAPEDAVACIVPELCAQIVLNRAEETSGNPAPGAVLAVADGSPGTAHVQLRGARITANEGYSLITQGLADSQVVLDGSLVADNLIGGGFGAFSAIGTDNALVVSASTITDNIYTGTGSTIFGTPVTCDPLDDEVGIHLRRSIIWEPGHSLLFTLFDPPQASCFTHLIANDFGWLGAAADRVVADPAFENAAAGIYRPGATSPALDFAPAHATDATLDQGARVINLPTIADRLGPQDLGAYERTFSPTVTASVATSGGTANPGTQSVLFGGAAHVSVIPSGNWHAVSLPGGNCPQGTWDQHIYTTGPITADCGVVFSFIHETSIALSASANPSVYGQNVTFTATLVGAVTPTGSVTFRDGPNVLGSVPISGIAASFSTSTLEPGTHAITAQYAGDALNTPATSAVLDPIVNRAATATTIAPISTIRFGQSATVTATVAAAPPGNGTPGGTITVASGPASCTITLPATSCALTPTESSGSLSVTASYSGDARFQASSGTQGLQVIAQYLGGTLSGVTASGLVLRLGINGEPAQISAIAVGATSFAFPAAVPLGANYVVTVMAHPAGLFCEVGNGSGVMPADDVGNVAIACSNGPHAVISVALDDGIIHARYGQTLSYTATLRNVGNAATSSVPVAGTANAALNAATLAWTCVAQAGASCGGGGSGALNDSVNLPVGGQVTYTISVPVRTTTAESVALFRINANDDEASASDADILVLFRNGFDPN